MPRRLILTPQAEKDIDDAYDWYESHDIGLGKEFARCVDEKITSVIKNPVQYPVVFSTNVRRVLTNRISTVLFCLPPKH